jgi:uncharacterized membrane protein
MIANPEDKPIKQQLEISITYAGVLAVLVLILAAVLRFYRLGDWSFWIEEIHSIRATIEIDSLTSLLKNARPLFFLISLPVVTWLGVSEWSTRLVPVLFGLASLPLVYWFINKFIGKKEALLAIFLLAISPWHIYWSQNFRFYTLLLFLYSICFFSFYLAVEKDSYKAVIVSIIFFLLALITHGIALVIVAVFILYYILLWVFPFEPPRGLRLRYLTPFVLFPLLGWGAYELIGGIYLGNGSLLEMLVNRFSKASPTAFVGYETPKIMLTATIYYIGTPLAFFTIPGSYYLIREKRPLGLFLSLGAYLPLFLFMVLTTIASTANRYVFMTLPCWVILAVVGLKKIISYSGKNKLTALWLVGLAMIFRDPVLKDVLYYAYRREFFILLVVAFLIGILLIARSLLNRNHAYMNLIGSFVLIPMIIHPILMDAMYYFYQGGHRDNMIAATSYLHEHITVGDEIYSYSPQVPSYYLNERVAEIRDLEITSPELDRKIWLIEDAGFEFLSSSSTLSSIKSSCREQGSWDQFVAGRIWKLRVHLCEPGK